MISHCLLYSCVTQHVGVGQRLDLAEIFLADHETIVGNLIREFGHTRALELFEALYLEQLPSTSNDAKVTRTQETPACQRNVVTAETDRF